MSEPLPAGWEQTRDSKGALVLHSPGELERAFTVRWWGAHHDGLYVEGYDYALVVPRAVLGQVLASAGFELVPRREGA